MGEVRFSHKPHRPSVMNQVKYFRTYKNYPVPNFWSDSKADMFRRFSVHRAIVQRKLGIYNCVYRRWIMGHDYGRKF